MQKLVTFPGLKLCNEHVTFIVIAADLLLLTETFKLYQLGQVIPSSGDRVRWMVFEVSSIQTF